MNEGSARSGKTFSILQVLIIIAMSEPKCIISVTSPTIKHLKGGAIRDFKNIMETYFEYEPRRFNNSELFYLFQNGSRIEFFSAYDDSKLRGPSRDYLFVNEIDTIDYYSYRQLAMRTRKKIFIDYNPDFEEHWVDDIIAQPGTRFIHSTYKHNIEFLTKNIITEIENLEAVDPYLWSVYGLGKRGRPKGVIYSNWQTGVFPNEGESVYGLDFGINHPTVLSEVKIINDNLYWKELIYESNLTNSELIQKLKNFKIGNRFIYCDSAEKNRIMELSNAGFNAHPAIKDVKTGIDFCSRFNITIENSSINALKEIKSYKWKETKDGQLLDEPVKFRDDFMDSARYATYSHYRNQYEHKSYMPDYSKFSNRFNVHKQFI